MKKNSLITAIIICSIVLVVVIVGMFFAFTKYLNTTTQTTNENAITSNMIYKTLEEPTNIYVEDVDSAQTITQVSKGTEVKFICLGKNGFYKVSVNGTEGYVRSDNLVDTTLATPTPAPTQEPVATVIPTNSGTTYSTKEKGADKKPLPKSSATNVQYTMYVCNVENSIYLREAGSESASIITTIPLGEAVGYIDSLGNGFYKIRYNGIDGYSKAQYLSTSKPYINSSRSGGTTMTVVGVANSIYLRSTPSANSSNIMEIPVGATVDYLGDAGNGFYKIRYAGCVGYGTAEYLR